MNTLRLVADHALQDAADLEADAKQKKAEANIALQRAASLRVIYEEAIKWETPATLHREDTP
jgi:predicted ATPase